MKKVLTFDDVSLVPKYSDITSRAQVDISVDLDVVLSLDIPIVGAPMDTVVGTDMAIALGQAGTFGVLHRYNTIEKQSEMVTQVTYGTAAESPVAAAIGATGDFLERAEELIGAGAEILCIDVAHGHHAHVKRAIGILRGRFGSDIHIMAGNVATAEAFEDLSNWGADSIRVGVGGGAACSTRVRTGHGVPVLESIRRCAESEASALLIADGGMRNSGDITKALAAGADLVMVGSLLAGTDESPGTIITDERTRDRYKVYRGMASLDAQSSWRDKVSVVEGVSTTIPYKGSVTEELDNLAAGIRSGLSYSGCSNLNEFRLTATFVRQTPAGLKEGSPHILGN
jgi:IMP dehydrogenase/GMP reductase